MNGWTTDDSSEFRDEGGYFDVPESLVDVHWDVIGLRGVGAYLQLARCHTVADYPDAQTLAKRLKVSVRQLHLAMDLLVLSGLIKEADCVAVFGAWPLYPPEDEPEPYQHQPQTEGLSVEELSWLYDTETGDQDE